MMMNLMTMMRMIEHRQPTRFKVHLLVETFLQTVSSLSELSSDKKWKPQIFCSGDHPICSKYFNKLCNISKQFKVDIRLQLTGVTKGISILDCLPILGSKSSTRDHSRLLVQVKFKAFAENDDCSVSLVNLGKAGSPALIGGELTRSAGKS